MKQQLAIIALASIVSVAQANELPIGGNNSGVVSQQDASLDKSNHAIQDNVSSVNGTTIDPSFVNQDSSTKNATSTSNGGTYTTGALTANGGSVGDNSSTATSGPSTSTVGNTTSTGGAVGDLSTGASTSTIGNTNQTTGGNSLSGTNQAHTGEITLTPTNTANGGTQKTDVAGTNKQGQSLADNSTTTAKVGNTSAASNQKLVGGDTTATQASNNQARTGSNTSKTEVDASDRSTTNYRSLALVLPTIQAAPATTLAGATMNQNVGVCGPRMDIQRDDVTGVYQGLMFKTKINQGHDDLLVSKLDANGQPVIFKQALVNGNIVTLGHQPIITTAIIGLGGSKNLGLGGGGNGGGSWGQAGAGSSAQTQRMITNIQLVDCVVAVTPIKTVANIKE